MRKPPPTEPQTGFKLGADDARQAVLVRAVELEDPRGEILGIELRREATREALAGRSFNARRLAARAHALSERLAKTHPQLIRRLRAREIPNRWFWILQIVAFIGGLATNALGPDRAVNVLAPPLVGLLAWNVAIYFWLAARLVIPTGSKDASSWWQRFFPWPSESPPGDGSTAEDRVTARFVELWLPAARPLIAARIRSIFHSAALSAVLGVISGMYARGLALEYRATWESTFLNAGAVDRFLGWILAPARGILGADLPSAAEIAAPASGPAGPWIHAWAVSALLIVGLPRLILALVDGIQARGRVEVQMPDGYLRRLAASVDTREEHVQLMLYSYRAGEKALTRLRTLILDLVGARAQVRVAQSLDYGDDPPDASGAGFRVAVFNAGQTPEIEVHGEWLQGLIDRRVDGQSLLVIIDESPYKKRLGDDSGERLDSRRRAWRRALDHIGLTGIFLELDDSDSLDARLEEIAEAVWPDGSSK